MLLRMPSPRRAFCLLLLLTAVLPAQAPKVGAAGDLARAEVLGADDLGRDRVLAAIAASKATARLGHPDAAREAWLRFVEVRASGCLRSNGHLQATAAVQWDADRERLRIELVPGPRFRCGLVEARGNQAVATAALAAAFAERWQPGEPVRLSASFGAELSERLRQAYRQAGHHGVEGGIEVEPRDDGTATLVVTVRDEGPLHRVAAVAVEGEPDATAREAVTARLQELVGEPWHAATRERLQASIDALARYHPVTVEDRAGADGAVALTVRVVPVTFGLPIAAERPELPRLRAGRDWLLAALASTHAFHVLLEARPGQGPIRVRTLEAWLSGQGLLVRADGVQAGERELGEVWLWGSADGFGLCLPGARVCATFDVDLQTRLQLRLVPESPDSMEARWGVGWSNRKPGQPAIGLDAVISDLAFARILTSDQQQVRLQDGVLEVVPLTGDARLRVLADDTVELRASVDEEPGRLSVELAPSVLQKRLAGLQEEWRAAGVVDGDLRALLGATGAAELMQAAWQQVGRAVGAELPAAAQVTELWPLLRAVAAAQPAFARPADEAAAAIRLPEAGVRATFADQLLEVLALDQPFGSWCERLHRVQAQLRTAGSRTEAEASLREWAAWWDDHAPGAIGHWLAAEAFAARGVGQLAQRLAAGAREHLDAAAAGAELASLLPRTVLPAIGAAVRADPAVRALVAAADDADDTALGAATVEVLWQRLLRSVLAARLRALAG